MLDEELKKLLKENIEVSRESLKILHKMNRARIMGRVFSFLKWTLIIGVSVWSYLQLQPFIEKYMGLIQNISSEAGKIGNLGSQINKFLPK